MEIKTPPSNTLKMLKKITLSLVIILISLGLSSSFAQNSFGIEFGHNFENYSGRSYLFDSISVIPNVGQDPGEAFGGIFYNYEISRRFTIHGKLNYGQRFYSYRIFNSEKECTFCSEALKLQSIKSLAFEFFPQYSLVNNKSFKLNFFGGISTTFNIYSSNGDEVLENEPGVTEAFNALESTVRPVTIGLGYGASLEVSRFMFWAKVNPPVQFTKEIEIFDQKYDFQNSWGFVSLSLGYKFYSFKLKNSLKLQ